MLLELHFKSEFWNKHAVKALELLFQSVDQLVSSKEDHYTPHPMNYVAVESLIGEIYKLLQEIGMEMGINIDSGERGEGDFFMLLAMYHRVDQKVKQLTGKL